MEAKESINNGKYFANENEYRKFVINQVFQVITEMSQETNNDVKAMMEKVIQNNECYLCNDTNLNIDFFHDFETKLRKFYKFGRLFSSSSIKRYFVISKGQFKYTRSKKSQEFIANKSLNLIHARASIFDKRSKSEPFILIDNINGGSEFPVIWEVLNVNYCISISFRLRNYRPIFYYSNNLEELNFLMSIIKDANRKPGAMKLGETIEIGHSITFFNYLDQVTQINAIQYQGRESKVSIPALENEVILNQDDPIDESIISEINKGLKTERIPDIESPKKSMQWKMPYLKRPKSKVNPENFLYSIELIINALRFYCCERKKEKTFEQFNSFNSLEPNESKIKGENDQNSNGNPPIKSMKGIGYYKYNEDIKLLDNINQFSKVTFSINHSQQKLHIEPRLSKKKIKNNISFPIVDLDVNEISMIYDNLGIPGTNLDKYDIIQICGPRIFEEKEKSAIEMNFSDYYLSEMKYSNSLKFIKIEPVSCLICEIPNIMAIVESSNLLFSLIIKINEWYQIRSNYCKITKDTSTLHWGRESIIYLPKLRGGKEVSINLTVCDGSNPNSIILNYIDHYTIAKTSISFSKLLEENNSLELSLSIVKEHLSLKNANFILCLKTGIIQQLDNETNVRLPEPNLLYCGKKGFLSNKVSLTYPPLHIFNQLFREDIDFLDAKVGIPGLPLRPPATKYERIISGIHGHVLENTFSRRNEYPFIFMMPNNEEEFNKRNYPGIYNELIYKYKPGDYVLELDKTNTLEVITIKEMKDTESINFLNHENKFETVISKKVPISLIEPSSGFSISIIDMKNQKYINLNSFKWMLQIGFKKSNNHSADLLCSIDLNRK